MTTGTGRLVVVSEDWQDLGVAFANNESEMRKMGAFSFTRGSSQILVGKLAKIAFPTIEVFV